MALIRVKRSSAASVVRSNGLWGATQPAKTEQNTQMRAITAATMATGEVLKLWATSLSHAFESVCLNDML